MSQLVQTPLVEDELLGMVFLLLLGGHLTATHMIGNGILALLQHPEQLAALRADESLTNSTVEELLRFDGPLELSSVYFATRAVELGGVRIPRRAQIRVLLSSANRDEQVFPDAEKLVLARNPRRHLAFGQGIHYCLGAALARMEGQVAIRKLLTRMPMLRLAVPVEDLRWQPNPIIRGLQHLPVTF